MVTHVGRLSGTVYRTPILGFPTTTGFTIALTYGPEADWVKNVMAAGGCRLHYQGRSEVLQCPRIIKAAAGMADLPPLVRPVLRLLRVRDFLALEPGV